jgi:P-type Ca2+ transporter type 2C
VTSKRLFILTFHSSRRIDSKFNIFEGIFRNWFFIAISLIMIGGQILIAFIGGRAFSVTRLNGAQWAYSLVLGALSIPVGVIVRLIPDKFFEKVNLIMKRLPSRLTVSEE